MNQATILSLMCRKLAPFVILFGFYLVSYGHLTPGGGFQGGVVIASGVILLLLGQESQSRVGLVNTRLFGIAETAMLLLFILIGGLGIVFGRAFLQILGPIGDGGRLQDAGFILVLNVIIGMKVGAGVTVIAYRLFMDA